MNQDATEHKSLATEWLDLLCKALDGPLEFSALVHGADIVRVSAALAQSLGYKDFRDLEGSGGLARCVTEIDGNPIREKELVQGLISAPDQKHIVTLKARRSDRDGTYESQVHALPDGESFLVLFSPLEAANKDRPVIDSLTGASTKSSFMDQLREELAHRNLGRDPMSSSLIFMSVDRFRGIKDELGEAVGDTILREAARLMYNNIRVTDRLARWDDNEFLVLAGAGSDLRRAKRVAERLRRKIEGNNFNHVSSVVTCSLAVTEIGREDTIDTLLNRLREGLVSAVAQGGNRVELA